MDNKDKKERVIIPAICLLMSIGLWFYVSNVENTIRKYDLRNVPVELLNVEVLKESKLVLSPSQEFYVDLKLEGSNEIYKIKREDFKITVDVSDYALKKGENKMIVNIVDAPDDLTIKNTNSLNIVINLEEISEKTMEIKSEISVTAKGGYFVAPIEINPKEVKVIGAESLVDRVDAVVVRGEIVEAEEDIVNTYDLIAVDNTGKEVKGIELQKENVDILIKVSKGRSIPIKMKTTGELPSNLKLQSIDGSRKNAEIVGPKELLDQIVELETEVIDLSQIKDNTEITVGVVAPPGVTLVQGEELITVKISVIKVVSKNIEIGFNLSGITEGLIITPVKTTINIKVTAFEDEIGLVTADNIKVDLNVESLKEEGVFDVAPIITSVGLSSSVSVVSTENISCDVKKIVEPPVVEVP
ncbi:CdaR family protein [Clostridium sp.]|uniref:CdaR family protein n=1 Tax=Clostridium sp. TaxID=1506 RepID=UPI002FC7B95C